MQCKYFIFTSAAMLWKYIIKAYSLSGFLIFVGIGSKNILKALLKFLSVADEALVVNIVRNPAKIGFI